MAASGLELEPITHQSVQSIKALSHIRGSNRQIDPGRRSDSKHGSLMPFPRPRSGLATSPRQIQDALQLFGLDPIPPRARWLLALPFPPTLPQPVAEFAWPLAFHLPGAA